MQRCPPATSSDFITDRFQSCDQLMPVLDRDPTERGLRLALSSASPSAAPLSTTSSPNDPLLQQTMDSCARLRSSRSGSVCELRFCARRWRPDRSHSGDRGSRRAGSYGRGVALGTGGLCEHRDPPVCYRRTSGTHSLRPRSCQRCSCGFARSCLRCRRLAWGRRAVPGSVGGHQSARDRRCPRRRVGRSPAPCGTSLSSREPRV